jgi:hypothetical protein
VTLPNQERLLRVFAFSCDAANNCAAPVQTFVIRDVTPPAQQNGASFAVAAAGSVVVGGVTILPSPLYEGVINTGSARSAGDVAVVDEAGAAVADVHAFRFSLSRATLQNASLQSFRIRLRPTASAAAPTSWCQPCRRAAMSARSLRRSLTRRATRRRR